VLAIVLALAATAACEAVIPATEPPYTRCAQGRDDLLWVFEPVGPDEDPNPPVALDLALAAARGEAGRVDGVADVCLGLYDTRQARPGPRPEPGRLAYRIAFRRGAGQVVVIVDALDARILATGRVERR
jgi:hypothetical protein